MSPFRESFDGGRLARRSVVFSHPPALNLDSPPMGPAGVLLGQQVQPCCTDWV